MSPALFLFEVFRMGKLTRGPLVLYHLPKFVCVEVLRPSQPNGVMSRAVSLPSHTPSG